MIPVELFFRVLGLSCSFSALGAMICFQLSVNQLLTPAQRRSRRARRLAQLEARVFQLSTQATQEWIEETDYRLGTLCIRRIEQRTGCRYDCMDPAAQKRLEAAAQHELDNIVKWTIRGAR